MHESYWRETAGTPRFPVIGKNVHVDVAIVGGGITGITAAYLLKRAGRTVAILERNTCATIDTGHTSAHLTCVTDARLMQLAKNFGTDHAGAVWDAGLAAIGQIEEICAHRKINCDYRRVPGFLHASLERSGEEEYADFENETFLAQKLGFDAALVRAVPLFERSGMVLANQAKFHPLRYLAGVLHGITGGGSHIFEQSPAEEVSVGGAGAPVVLKSHAHRVECDYVVMATHAPIPEIGGEIATDLLQTKVAAYTSYAIGARVAPGAAPECLMWDTSNPYYYLRVDAHPTHDYLIFGGADHKTGQEDDPAPRYARLADVLRAFVPQAEVDCMWSGRVMESHDGLPLIGWLSERVFVATGFGGNGMTFGTVGGMMARDAILGFPNPWQKLFDPRRKQIPGGAWDYVKENLSYPYYMVKDRLRTGQRSSLVDLPLESGAVLTIGGKRVAAYRDGVGRVTTLSPVCTHLGCIVHWNAEEKTWDCPCHGSRFKCTGEVLSGPADRGLGKVSVE